MSSVELVPTATAAFIAGLTDRQMQRVVDEHILEEPLVSREDGRNFAVMSTALASFFYAANEEMTREARLRVIQAIIARVSERSNAQQLFSLEGNLQEVDWSVDLMARNLTVQLKSFVAAASNRKALVSRAHESIDEDPQVMGGAPVFKGTRVPISIVAASKEAGFGLDEMRAAYAFLTPELIEDALTYQQIHRKMGRPRKSEETPATRAPIVKKVVALPARR